MELLRHHQRLIENHEERIRSLEISRAKFMGYVMAMSAIGSIAGSALVLLVEHFWK